MDFIFRIHKLQPFFQVPKPCNVDVLFFQGVLNTAKDVFPHLIAAVFYGNCDCGIVFLSADDKFPFFFYVFKHIFVCIFYDGL